MGRDHEFQYNELDWVTDTRFALLKTLHGHDETCSMQQILEETGFTNGTAGSAIIALMQKRLVIKERRGIYRISEKGEEACAYLETLNGLCHEMSGDPSGTLDWITNLRFFILDVMMLHDAIRMKDIQQDISSDAPNLANTYKHAEVLERQGLIERGGHTNTMTEKGRKVTEQLTKLYTHMGGNIDG